ncbi:hypothetical protein MRX96_002317 [Rhipicephalus microplus]
MPVAPPRAKRRRRAPQSCAPPHRETFNQFSTRLRRIAIAVAATSIDKTPDDIAGWVVASQRGKKSSGSAETPL